MVQCNQFTAWGFSPLQLIGLSPKIKFQCGACLLWNKTRIPMSSIKKDEPYAKCDYCLEVNYFPIQVKGDRRYE